MPGRSQHIDSDPFLDPAHQYIYPHRVVRGRHGSQKVVCLVQAFHAQGSLRQSDPLNCTLQNPPKRVTDLEKGKLDARRAAIDGQDAGVSWFHG
jgi:hypothetical protein